MPSFIDLGVSQRVSDALQNRGIDAPFKIQQLVIADAIAGRDVLAKSRTGSGKTLAFAVPIVERLEASQKMPAALVLVPTRELCVQVTDEFTDIGRARGLKVASVYGGVGLQDQARRAQKAHILVATPGRLEDLVQRRLLNLSSVRILVLDEADRMLDMGFQPQVDRIVDRLPHDRQTMFFSATLDGQVGYLARAYTKDAAQHEVVDPKQTVEEADHKFIPVTASNKVDKLIELLSKERELALVFVRTKRGADRLVKKLSSQGVEAVAMHGDKSQGQRERALARFAAGKVDTLVATDVAARGIDVDDISHVINFDPPDGRDAYLHRVGRTARAGRAGVGITFVERETAREVERIARSLRLQREFAAAVPFRAHG